MPTRQSCIRWAVWPSAIKAPATSGAKGLISPCGAFSAPGFEPMLFKLLIGSCAAQWSGREGPRRPRVLSPLSIALVAARGGEGWDRATTASAATATAPTTIILRLLRAIVALMFEGAASIGQGQMSRPEGARRLDRAGCGTGIGAAALTRFAPMARG